ncbi:hypothetical protein ACFFMN_13690 [Planobispora siamensis]|uniref:AMIN-like domain-containing protein n=1 Tax=Planobispora siamensis TaxID=936338 RepID=A0A8J3WHM0_9ACTN|nr:hypothetical protein [Planobispora siamensis]GIH89585.1 hypothetical protein Psi01_02150 [Planobispora siamensis]
MNRSRAALALVPLVLLLAGCGGATTRATPAPAAQETTAEITEAPEPASPDSSSGSSPDSSVGSADLKPPTGTRTVEVKRSLEEPPIVTGVRYAEHRGFDRVVVDYRGALPGYRVEWVPELVQDGSGEPFKVEGGAYLQVTIIPANAHDEDGTPTWKGGPIFKASLGNVKNVVRTGDFEAVVGVGIVLEHRAGFRVKEYRSPNRLVIDVAH